MSLKRGRLYLERTFDVWVCPQSVSQSVSQSAPASLERESNVASQVSKVVCPSNAVYVTCYVRRATCYVLDATGYRLHDLRTEYMKSDTLLVTGRMLTTYRRYPIHRGRLSVPIRSTTICHPPAVWIEGRNVLKHLQSHVDPEKDCVCLNHGHTSRTVFPTRLS